MKRSLSLSTLVKLTGSCFALASIFGFTGPASTQKKHAPAQRVEFSREFAPTEGFVKGPEKETRQELCLNGKWDFEPIYGPYNQKKTKPYGIEANETGADLPDATQKWDDVKMKVPSPIGGGQTFPSYPAQWARAQMGWLRKKFMMPANWNGKHIIIRFTAVSGDTKVLLNGKLIGTNFDSGLPFEFDVTDKLKKGENEIMVGMRDHNLFTWQGAVGKLTFPPRGGGLGIWQDVFLVALPDVYVSDVFVKPNVSKNLLQAQVTVRNSTNQDQSVDLNADVRSWINLTGKDSLSAPEIKWKLGTKTLDLGAGKLVVPAGKEAVITLQATVNNKLKLWDFKSPNLYGMTVSLAKNNQVIDKKYERFGWREFHIVGKNLFLNGQKTQLLGDAQHLQNVAGWSRRYAWSWFKLLKDAGANAARLHAQVYPECFHDMADEMGIAVLPESLLYASSCDLNYDSELFWKASQDNVRRLVKKYRNHASVYGWSVENEVMPALTDKTIDVTYRNMVYDGVVKLVNICLREDNTRNWVSGDGSRDMNGRLPVYNDHYGMGPEFAGEASVNKPFAVGETGMAFYGMPRLAETLVGDRAYRSFNDFADAEAIDAFDLLKAQRPVAAYCSVWNLGYYGVELLPLGLTDLTKAPEKEDGVYLTAPYEEGKPGIQPEKINAYATHYNPGYDNRYPLYKPLPLFYAVKAAYHQPFPAPNKWDHHQTYPVPAPPVIKDAANEVLFLGKEDGDLFYKLKAAGIPVVMQAANTRFIVVDCNSVNMTNTLENRIKNVVKGGGTVLYWGLTPDNRSKINSSLPYSVEVFERPALSLVPDEKDRRVAAISYHDLYFSENTDSKRIQKYGLKGAFVDKGHIMLKACPTDFVQDNISAMIRSQKENPVGPALVEVKEGAGAYLLSTVNLEVMSTQHIRMVGKLFRNLGVAVKDVPVKRGTPLDQSNVLTRVLVSAGYRAASFDEAMEKDFIGDETIVKPQFGPNPDGRTWDVKQAVDGVLNFGRQPSRRGRGPEPVEERGAGVVYLSYWVQSPKTLSGSAVGFKLNVAGGCKIWVNGEEQFSSAKQSSENMENLSLHKGWNHFMIKLVQGAQGWSFAGRLASTDYSLLAAMQSALNPNFDKGNFYTISHNDAENVYGPSWSMNVDGWHQSFLPGATAKIKFYGTGISMKGKTGPDGGIAKIYIDGKPAGMVDFKNTIYDNFKQLYTRSGLKDGEHEFTVEVVKGHVGIGAMEQFESFK
ncbi:MAG TPA: glycoside hydrolase family 2 TIM barrel-domain containing protein [Mucilaginibacter sp.]|jgi:beta-galactosidase|nr:glycoside hydrolase family 2 TIM barrel-domain containing protein [Mucilaginibacter sp.]